MKIRTRVTWRSVLGFAVLAFVPIRTWSSEPNLAELEAELAAKKRAQPTRPPPGKTPAPRKESTAASDAKADARQQATLVVRSDAPCKLALDGKPIVDLEARQTRSLAVADGDTLVECQSISDPEAAYAAKNTFLAGRKFVLQIELSESIKRFQESRRAADGKPVTAVAAAPPSSSSPRGASSVTPAVTSTASRSSLAPPAGSTAGTASPASPQAALTATPASDGWSRVRAELRGTPDLGKLSHAMEVFLDARDSADKRTIADFDSYLSSKHWNSCLAMGTKNGLLIWGAAWNQWRADFAKEFALADCDRNRPDAKCTVVWVNGKISDEGVAAVARRVGERRVDEVRAAIVREWGKFLTHPPP